MLLVLKTDLGNCLTGWQAALFNSLNVDCLQQGRVDKGEWGLLDVQAGSGCASCQSDRRPVWISQIGLRPSWSCAYCRFNLKRGQQCNNKATAWWKHCARSGFEWKRTTLGTKGFPTCLNTGQPPDLICLCVGGEGGVGDYLPIHFLFLLSVVSLPMPCPGVVLPNWAPLRKRPPATNAKLHKIFIHGVPNVWLICPAKLMIGRIPLKLLISKNSNLQLLLGSIIQHLPCVECLRVAD